MGQAVIQGVFSDLKNIKTRSCVQIVIEVPIEQAGMVIDALGWPQPGAEIPVAIARLNDEAAAIFKHNSHEAPTSKEVTASSPIIEPIPYPQQITLLCEQEAFQDWLFARFQWPEEYADGKSAAAFVIRRYCHVSSRSDIQAGTEPGRRWYELFTEYQSDHQI